MLITGFLRLCVSISLTILVYYDRYLPNFCHFYKHVDGSHLLQNASFTYCCVVRGFVGFHGQVAVVQLLSCDSVTPRIAACLASLSLTISWSLLRFMSTESVMLSNHLIIFCPLLLDRADYKVDGAKCKLKMGGLFKIY